jgi:hypothetical protein
MIHEIKQFLWVITPHGDGHALFIIDYGPHENTVWVVALEEDGAIKHYEANDIRLCKNNTFKININERKLKTSNATAHGSRASVRKQTRPSKGNQAKTNKGSGTIPRRGGKRS